jgi:hypothetical protein
MARRVQEGSSEREIPDPLEGKLLLSVREVAKALGVSRMTVYRLVKEGKLKLVYPTPPLLPRYPGEPFGLPALPGGGREEGRGGG